MPIHNTALPYALWAETHSRPPCVMNDTYFPLRFQLAPICLFMEPQCADRNLSLPVSPWARTHHGNWACNGQFGGGAVRLETLFLASPRGKDNLAPPAPDLLCFPPAGSLSTTFKVLSPTPCLGAEHQAGHRAAQMHRYPPALGMLCLGGMSRTSPAGFLLGWLGQPVPLSACSPGESGRKPRTGQPSQTQRGETLQHGFSEMTHAPDASPLVS